MHDDTRLTDEHGTTVIVADRDLVLRYLKLAVPDGTYRVSGPQIDLTFWREQGVLYPLGGHQDGLAWPSRTIAEARAAFAGLPGSAPQPPQSPREVPVGEGDVILDDGSIVPRERVLLLGTFRGYPAWESGRGGWDVLVEAPAVVAGDAELLRGLEEFVRSFDQEYAEDTYDLDEGGLDDCPMDWAVYHGDRWPHHCCVLTVTGEWTTLPEAPEVLLRNVPQEGGGRPDAGVSQGGTE